MTVGSGATFPCYLGCLGVSFNASKRCHHASKAALATMFFFFFFFGLPFLMFLLPLPFLPPFLRDQYPDDGNYIYLSLG
ncbi:hypothetical protein F5Y13DRAFT_169428 [Hypoxylon sp. FL1857]|nr:hypothetical protein F5Y13DRAFT_169428 [Hypoxylon sp. FL1857]